MLFFLFYRDHQLISRLINCVDVIKEISKELMKCSFSSPYSTISDAAQVIQETTDKQEKGKQTNV
jgi:hypothetical protein